MNLPKKKNNTVDLYNIDNIVHVYYVYNKVVLM